MKKTSASVSKSIGTLLALGSLMAFAGSAMANNTNGAWKNTGTTSANWTDATNWVAVPGNSASAITGTNADTSVATFNVAIGASNFGTVATPIIIDSATENIKSITFDTAAGNYNIGSTSGNSLYLTSGGTIQIVTTLTATNAQETINAPLVIEGAAGTYTIANNSASGAGAGAGTFTIAGQISGGNAGATVLTINGTNTNANTISGKLVNGTATTLGLTKAQAGTWVLTGANTYSGPTNVTGGILNIQSNGALGSSSLVTISSGATLQLQNNITTTNATPLKPNGAGVGGNGAIENVSGTNTYTGQITWGNSAVTLGSDSGTLILSNTGATGNGGATTITIVGAGNGVLSGQLNVAGVPFVKNGTGTWTLNPTASNGYTGATTINAGALNAATNGALAGSGATVASGAALQFSGNSTSTIKSTINGTGVAANPKGALENTSGNNTYSGAITLGSASTIGSDAGTLTLSSGTAMAGAFALTLTGAGNGVISSTITVPTSVTQTGAGVWSLSGTNNYAGASTISSGTLEFQKEVSLYNNVTGSWTTTNIPVSSGATLAVYISDTQTNGDFKASDLTILAPVAGNTAGAFLGLDTAPGNFTYATAFTVANMGLAKLGINTLTLTGANTYGGPTKVSGGILTTGTTGVLNNGSSASSFIGISSNAAGNLILDGGTFQYASTGAASSTDRLFTLTQNGGTIDASGTNPVTFAGNGGNLIAFTGAGARTLTLTGTNTGANTFAPILGDGTGGSTGLTKTGAGSWTITGANTYTGATSVSAGTLVLGAGGSLGGTAVTIASGGTLQVNDTNTIGTGSAGSLTVGPGGIVSLANGTANTLTLSSTGTGLNFSSGNLTFDVGSSIDQILGSGLTANITGGNTINLVITGTVSGSSQNLITWGSNTGVGTFSIGTITGSTPGYILSLTENGTGLVLNETLATNAYWQGAGVSTTQSWLDLTNFASDLVNTPRATALDGATIVTFVGPSGTNFGATTLDANTTINNLNFNTNGVVINSGTGSNTLTIASSLNGITVNTGGAAAETINSNVAISASQNWLVTGANENLNVNGAVSGAGFVLTKTGAGTLTLSGANTYGSTTVSAGIAVAGVSNVGTTSGAFGPSTAPVTLGDSGTTNNNTSPSLQIGGAFTVTNPITIANQATTGAYSIGGSSANTSTLSGAITANKSFAVTQVSGGTLNITGGISGASAGVKTVNFSNVGAVNVSGVAIADGAGGTVTVTQSGAGTTTFSVANTYTGGTTISAGSLALNGAATLGSVNSALTMSGGSLDLGGTSQTVGLLTGSSGITDSTGTSTLTIGSGNATGGTYSGALTNNGGTLSLTKIGTGTEILSGTSTYTGTTTVGTAAGTLTLSGSLTGSNINVTAGTLSETSAGSINGTGVTLTVGGAGSTIVLAGANTFTGATTVNSGGTLNIANANALANTSGLTLASGGALQISGGITTPTSLNVSLNGTGTGAGALDNPSGNNNFTGTITLAGNTTIGSDTGGTALTISNTAAIAGGGFGLTLTGTGNGNLGSPLDATTASLTKTGTGAWTLSNATPYTFAGAITLNGGTLNIGNNVVGGALTITSGTLGFSSASDLPAGSFNLGSVANPVGLSYTGPAGTVATSINFTGTTGTATLGNGGSGLVTFGGTLTFNGAGAKTIQLGNAADTFGGTISGNITNATGGALVGVTKAGNGTWILGGTDTYTGNTVVNAGVLQISATDLSTGLASSNINVTNTVGFNAVLQTSGTLNRVFGAGAGQLNWTATGSQPNNGAGFAAFGAPLNINISLTTVGNSAVLNWGGGGGTYPNSVTILAGGGSGMLFGSPTANNVVTLQNSVNLGIVDGFSDSLYVIKGTGGDYAVISGVIMNGTGTPAQIAAAAAGFIKLGNGTLVLSGPNTYSGGTTVYGGTIVAGIDSPAAGPTTTGAFGSGNGPSGAPNIPLYGTINLGGGVPGTGLPTNAVIINPTVLTGGAFNIGRPINAFDGGTNQVYSIGGNTATNSTFSGAITFVNSVASGNTFTIQQVAGGTVNITGGITSTAGAGVTNTINFVNIGNVNVTTTPIGNGATATVAVTQSGSGITTLAAANTYTGATNITAGTLQIGNGSTTGSLSTSSVITDAGTLIFNRSNAVVQGTDFTATAIGGAGNLIQAGSGTLSLSSANTYSGNTSVLAGTMAVNSILANGTAQPLGTGTTTIALGNATTPSHSAVLQYTGASAANLGRGITVAAGDSATISNTGGSLLTLSGTLTKGNSTLIFSGGSFDLTGNITGGTTSDFNSDLVVSGASTLTLDTTSADYTGPTKVYGGSTLKDGVGTMPVGTVLTLGDASDPAGPVTNTFDMNGDNQTIASLNSVSQNSNVNVVTNTGGSSHTLTISGVNSDSVNVSGTFNGAITDGASSTGQTGLTVSGGTGLQTFGGANTYTGPTNLTGGNTSITGSLGNTPVSVNGGNLSLDNAGAINQNTLTVTSGTVTESVDNAIGGSANLTVNTGSSFTVAHANNYTGTTNVNGGSTLNLNVANAASGTSTVNVNSGSVVFGANNAVNNTANIAITQGNTVALNGTTQTIGTLTLTGSGFSHIDLTTIGTSILTIANDVSIAAGSNLDVIGWQGTAGAASSVTEIILSATAASDFTASGALSSVTWSGGGTGVYNGTGALLFDLGGGNFQLTPSLTAVPEPTTVFAGLGLVLLLAWRGRRQIIEVSRRAFVRI